MRKVTTHELKTLPKYFEDVFKQIKMFEIRKNDRDFKAMDRVVLKEWDNGYTGREIETFILYVLDDEMFCKEGYVTFSISAMRIHRGFEGSE